MKKTTLLINGVSLPYHVLDKALEHAKNNRLPVLAVFIYENIDEKDYKVSPEAEEMSKAELSESNAAKNLEELVQHNSSYVETFFDKNDIVYEVVILRNPTIGEIVNSLKTADQIFIDHDTFTHPDEFAYVNFTLEDLEEQIAAKIVWCKRPK
jgi:hypothetical protein